MATSSRAYDLFLSYNTRDHALFRKKSPAVRT
jgi:hypothetical protein